MNRLLGVILIGLASATSLHAQNDTVKLSYSPMSGHILLSAAHDGGSAYHPGLGEDIYAKDSAVHSVLPGTVTATFSKGKDNYMLVSTGDIYIVYAQLKSCLYKKGDAVKQHELLGYAYYSEADASYKMNVQAWRSREGTSTEDKKLLLALVE